MSKEEVCALRNFKAVPEQVFDVHVFKIRKILQLKYQQVFQLQDMIGIRWQKGNLCKHNMFEHIALEVWRVARSNAKYAEEGSFTADIS